MASTINADNGVVSGSSGLKSTADTSGVLALQSNGSTGVTLNTDLSVTFAGAQTLSAGTANGVTYLNGSKVLTSGSALTFDGTTLALTGVQTITNSSGSTLILNRTGNPGSLQLNYDGTQAGQVQAASGGGLIFYQGSSPTEGMRLTSTGLGIGTSSNRNSTKLDVFGDISFGGNASYYGTLGYNAGAGYLELTSSDGGFKFIRRSGSALSLTLASSGAIGVGTSPSYGSSGQVLTSAGSGAAPTWSTPSAGAMVFITSATASNSSTLDIENAMTAYGMYVIIATGLNISAAGYLQAQLKIGGSYQTGSTYYWVTNRAMTPASASTGSGIDFIRFGEGNSLPSNTSYGMMLTMYLPNPSSTQYKTTSSVLSGFDANLTNVDFYNGVGGFRGSTGALTGVRFFCNNARTFNGVFRLYGIANS